MEHKHIGVQTCLRMRRVFLNACSLCNHSLQPLWALLHTRHGVINLISTFQILSCPLLMSPASRMATRRPTAFRTSCILASPLTFILHCQTQPNSYKQCLGKAQKHIQGHNCIKATQFGIQCQCSGLTHHPHPRFWKVLLSTSCSRYWPKGCRFQLTG